MPSNEWCAVAAPTSESNGGVSSQLQLLEVDPVFPNQSHNAPRVRVDRKAARYFHYVDPETKAPISTDSPGGVHMCKKSGHCHHKGYKKVNRRDMENHLRSKHPEDFQAAMSETQLCEMQPCLQPKSMPPQLQLQQPYHDPTQFHQVQSHQVLPTGMPPQLQMQQPYQMEFGQVQSHGVPLQTQVLYAHQQT